ncbi:hypothetical protein DSL72_000949 [Monilinia vaccinii-corymbosi]|uniref:Uncharacterized protein n=1 Tax=Monilinia vaccinii-corymbosi TaxID=61207 RepID=A0A8A3P575_9HELO|nr:hypothetical protein DSL72_000949 [Monilinia vaccinii-corymbosi]
METQLAGRDSVRYGETGFIKRDRYGAVSSGPLRIRCVLVEARVVLYPRRNSENVRRHTVQFSEEGPLDQNCPPGFSPNLHLDISSKEPSQRPLISDPISTDAMDLDMVFDTLSLTKEGSIDREEDMCQGSKTIFHDYFRSICQDMRIVPNLRCGKQGPQSYALAGHSKVPRHRGPEGGTYTETNNQPAPLEHHLRPNASTLKINAISTPAFLLVSSHNPWPSMFLENRSITNSHR